MITERVKGSVAGQKILFKTSLFGKDYFWMEDVDGTTYLTKSTDDQPDFT